MKSGSEGLRLRIFVHEALRHNHKPLYAAIVELARREGLAGATVARGIMGYGAHSAIHEPHLLRLSSDLPVVIEIVDADEKIHAFLPCLDEMVREGMITTSEVEIVTYQSDH